MAFGPIGTGIAALAIQEGHRLVAAVDIDPAKAGQPAAAFVPEAPADVTVTGDAARVLNAGADIVLHSTQSRLARVLPQLLPLVDAGLAVISTCEELAFPWHHHSIEAASLDALARSRGVGVVGLGVNPGFVMDLLPVILAAPCRQIRRITAARVVDVGQRRVPLQHKVGVGLTVEAFRRGVGEGRIGHVGLPQSAAMIAHALQWELSKIEESIEPVVGSSRSVLGVHQVCRGVCGNAHLITLDLTMAAGAEDPRDEIASTRRRPSTPSSKAASTAIRRPTPSSSTPFRGCWPRRPACWYPPSSQRRAPPAFEPSTSIEVTLIRKAIRNIRVTLSRSGRREVQGQEPSAHPLEMLDPIAPSWLPKDDQEVGR